MRLESLILKFLLLFLIRFKTCLTNDSFSVLNYIINECLWHFWPKKKACVSL